jgi:hypothetical protein
MKKSLLIFLLIVSVFSFWQISFAQQTPPTGEWNWNFSGQGGPPAPPNSGDTGIYVMDPNQLENQPIVTPPFDPTPAAVFCHLRFNPKAGDILDYATCIVARSIVPTVFFLAVAIFVWGVVQYWINAEDEAKREQGKKLMIWGLIAVTVILSIWGLVNILGGTFHLENAAPPPQ